MNSKPIALFRAALGLALAATLLACQPAPQQSLANAKIPRGFLFANKRPVTVSISAKAHALASTAAGIAPVQVVLADGTVLFRGTAQADQPLSVKVPVPLKESALYAILTLPHGTSRVQLPITAGAASGLFQ